jgi:hypothetical protein
VTDDFVKVDGVLVNSDLVRIARSYERQASAIGDDEPHASERRQRLHRAAGYLHFAYAELDGIPLPRARNGRTT